MPMNSAVLVFLAASTAVFMVANSLLKAYAVKGAPLMLVAALAAFCLGNWLMVRVMRENGLGLGLALSLVFQLVAITAIAWAFFGERPGPLQLAGVALGVVSIAMIAWPSGGDA
jgi:multidrug transporter EmrE-like cation transporter